MWTIMSEKTVKTQISLSLKSKGAVSLEATLFATIYDTKAILMNPINIWFYEGLGKITVGEGACNLITETE